MHRFSERWSSTWKHGKANPKNVTLEPEVSMSSIFSLYFNDIFCLLLHRPIENGCYISAPCKKTKTKKQNYQWYRYLYSCPLADQTTNLSKFTYGLADHLNSYIKALLCLECSDGWGLRSFTLQTMHYSIPRMILASIQEFLNAGI